MKDFKETLANSEGGKVFVVIYPHPDDETMAAGGSLLAAKKKGFKTVAVILTKGEAGQAHINLRGRMLSEIRQQELERAAQILGIDELVVGNFKDGKLRESAKEWQPWVLDKLKKFQPGIVVTYDPSGMSGHPDHISLSLRVKEIISDMPGPKRPKLFWTTAAGFVRDRRVNKEVISFLTAPTHSLGISLGDMVKKYLAARSHRSQKLGKSLPIPLLLALLLFGRSEWYHEVDLNKKYPYKFIPFKI